MVPNSGAAGHPKRIIAIFVFIFLVATPERAIAGEPPLVVGLDADMSGPAAESGIAIRRGAEIAIDEINRAGGVLGRPLKLVVKNHRGNPARGRDNIADFVKTPNLVAVLGGKHSPVVFSQLDIVHQYKVPLLLPWSAATGLVANGYDPNFVFRVSVRDSDAGGFLVDAALNRGFQHPVLILERTTWGRSNDRAITKALALRDRAHNGVVWVNRGETDMDKILHRAKRSRSDVVLLVASTREAVGIVRAMALWPKAERLPIISHWAVTGGVFFAQTRSILDQVDLTFLQTYSFLEPTFPERAASVARSYRDKYGVDGARNIAAPSGVAHAYDLLHMLALAIDKAGSADREAIQRALLGLKRYVGLVRDYNPPFRPGHQDALSAADFRLGRFAADGAIEPLPNKIVRR